MRRTRDGGTVYDDVSIERVGALIYSGLDTDGEHHKQWALAEIARALGFDISAYHSDDLGTPP